MADHPVCANCDMPWKDEHDPDTGACIALNAMGGEPSSYYPADPTPTVPPRAPAEAAEVEQAIREMEFYRKTHVDWAEHFEKHPELAAQYIATGEWDDANEHRRVVGEYDRVIRLLRALATRLAPSSPGGEPRDEANARDWVLALCERWGFGRVMQMAADEWKRRDPIGALTIGPCVGTLAPSSPGGEPPSEDAARWQFVRRHLRAALHDGKQRASDWWAVVDTGLDEATRRDEDGVEHTVESLIDAARSAAVRGEDGAE